MKINKLTPDPRNANLGTERGAAALASSLAIDDAGYVAVALERLAEMGLETGSGEVTQRVP